MKTYSCILDAVLVCFRLNLKNMCSKSWTGQSRECFTESLSMEY